MNEAPIRALYGALLDAWDRRDAAAMAACFTADGAMVGFDGSTVVGRVEIEAHLRPIFADHPTPAFVSKVREVRFLAPTVALLRAVAGMANRGADDIIPAVNEIQSLVAVQREERWNIALFQNTPAAFHGRPELSEQLTAELRARLKARPPRG